jgi:hypothetical protein
MLTEPTAIIETDEKPAALVLRDAVTSAARDLGLTQTEIAAIIGRDRTSAFRRGIDPRTKAGELSLLLIRAHRALGSIVGWNETLMQHWIDTPNTGLGDDTPRHLLETVDGLIRVVQYLEDTQGRP